MAKRARALRHRREANPDRPHDDPVPKQVAKPYDELPHSDKMEGIIRDPVMHNGKVVSYVKDIGVYDADYDPDVRKVQLQPFEGKPYVVPAVEINKTTAPQTSTSRGPDRVPHLTFPYGHPDALPGQGR